MISFRSEAARRREIDLQCAVLRVRRIERDMRVIEEELREQAAGSQDGYLIEIADKIRKILA